MLSLLLKLTNILLLNFELYFNTFMVFKTHPLQDIASCKAWDKLVELEKMKNTR